MGDNDGGDDQQQQPHQPQPHQPQLNQIYVTELRGADVLFGRGSGPNDHPGNIAFREYVAARKTVYMATSHRLTKTNLAKEILYLVNQNHGRFLRKVEDHLIPPGQFAEGLDVYEIVDDHTIMEKAKQALRQNATRAKEQQKQQQQQQQQQIPQSSSSAAASSSSAGMLAAAQLQLQRHQQMQQLQEESPADLGLGSQDFDLEPIPFTSSGYEGPPPISSSSCSTSITQQQQMQQLMQQRQLHQQQVAAKAAVYDRYHPIPLTPTSQLPQPQHLPPEKSSLATVYGEGTTLLSNPNIQQQPSYPLPSSLQQQPTGYVPAVTSASQVSIKSSSYQVASSTTSYEDYASTESSVSTYASSSNNNTTKNNNAPQPIAPAQRQTIIATSSDHDLNSLYGVSPPRGGGLLQDPTAASSSAAGYGLGVGRGGNYPNHRESLTIEDLRNFDPSQIYRSGPRATSSSQQQHRGGGGGNGYDNSTEMFSAIDELSASLSNMKSINDHSNRTNMMLMGSTDTMGTIDYAALGSIANMSIDSSTLDVFEKGLQGSSGRSADDRAGIVIPVPVGGAGQGTQHQAAYIQNEVGSRPVPPTDGVSSTTTPSSRNSRQGSLSSASKSRASRQSGESANSSMSFESSGIGFDGLYTGVRRQVEQEFQRSEAILEEESTSYDALVPTMGQSSLDIIKALESDTSEHQLPSPQQSHYDQEPE